MGEATLSLTTYLCPNNADGIFGSDYPEGCEDGTDLEHEDDGSITARLLPDTFEDGTYFLTAGMVQLSRNERTCKGVNAPGCTAGTWPIQSAIDFTAVCIGAADYAGEEPPCQRLGFGPGFELDFVNPDDCRWLQTRLIGEHLGTFRLIAPAVTGGGAIPSTKYLVWNNTAFDWEVEGDLVPGEEVGVYWVYNDIYAEAPLLAGTTHVKTCCFTGGYITNIVGNQNSPGVQYDVDIEGGTIRVRPTDFYPYDVGDWVYILTTGGGCGNVDRSLTCQPPSSITSSGIILPLKHRGVGP